MPVLLWAAIVSSSYSWNLEGLRSNSQELARERARMVFTMVETTRLWNTNLGGVYAPVTQSSPSNPYLRVFEKDIVTPGGQHLTMINPTYMTRQIAEILNKGDLNINITSLRPLNPNNTPSDWERKALESFEDGAREQMEVMPNGHGPAFFYMAPLDVKEACLPCHRGQGYKVGEIRGGIRVSFPTASFDEAEALSANKLLNVHLLVFAMLSILSTTAIAWTRRLLDNLHTERDHRDAIIAETTGALRNEIRVKNRLFSIISHDLKSPFTALLGMTKIMSSMDDRLDKKQITDYAKDVHDAGGHMYELVQNLLDWSRLQMDGAKFEPCNTLMLDLIQDSLKVIKPAAKTKKVVLDIHGPNLLVYADQNMMQSVIRNLVGNAIKFTKAGGRITVDIEITDDTRFAQVTVSDSGIGIPKALLENLFSLDQKTTTRGTEGELGTGLGLPLTKEMVERNGGQIWVISSPGDGTTFYFTVPLAGR
ncbi:ATP-binding protein [Magnetovibrio sp. PR-2]|uniref:ATP-binding protein n=1 Tax=Magnetovibrio sp. PR-2 TaxID=3120356 RepID=UPI002FCE030D